MNIRAILMNNESGDTHCVSLFALAIRKAKAKLISQLLHYV